MAERTRQRLRIGAAHQLSYCEVQQFGEARQEDRWKARSEGYRKDQQESHLKDHREGKDHLDGKDPMSRGLGKGTSSIEESDLLQFACIRV